MRKEPLACAGVLLTGGASRRMGRDKASMVVPGESVSLAKRTANVLGRIARPVVEVGAGYSGLPTITEHPLGGGPLVAVAAGWAYLVAAGWIDPVVVVATDLPLVTPEALRWLARHPSPGSIVPMVHGRAQPLCARYYATDLEVAARLVAAGRRSMRDLLDAIHPELDAPPDPVALTDVDTPREWSELPGQYSLVERAPGPLQPAH